MTINDMADYMMEVVDKDFDKEIDHSIPLKPDHKYVKEYYAFLQMMLEDKFYTVWDLFRYARLAATDSDWLLSATKYPAFDAVVAPELMKTGAKTLTDMKLRGMI